MGGRGCQKNVFMWKFKVQNPCTSYLDKGIFSHISGARRSTPSFIYVEK